MTTNNRLPTPAGDQIDRLLTAYYRAEMPAHWPTGPRPWLEPARAKTEKSNPSTRSRWALAASVALLIGGCWYVSSQMTNGKKSTKLDFDGGSADLKHAKDAGKDKPKSP